MVVVRVKTMSDEFSNLLEAARSAANNYKAQAASSLASDQYPEFWRYAADITARWADALALQTLDWAVLGQLREEAKIEKNRAGIWLHAVCNSIEKDYVALREASFRTLDSECSV